MGNGLNYGGFDNVPLPLDRHVHVLIGIISQVGSVKKKRYAKDEAHEQHQKNTQHFKFETEQGNIE